MGNVPCHLAPAYKDSHFRFSSLKSQESELIENIIKQGVQGSDINESDYILKTTKPPGYPTLTTLNDIVMEGSNDRPQKSSSNDSKASFRTVHSAPIGHST